jgi:hypothetical protein
MQSALYHAATVSEVDRAGGIKKETVSQVWNSIAYGPKLFIKSFSGMLRISIPFEHIARLEEVAPRSERQRLYVSSDYVGVGRIYYVDLAHLQFYVASTISSSIASKSIDVVININPLSYEHQCEVQEKKLEIEDSEYDGAIYLRGFGVIETVMFVDVSSVSQRRQHSPQEKESGEVVEEVQKEMEDLDAPSRIYGNVDFLVKKMLVAYGLLHSKLS